MGAWNCIFGTPIYSDVGTRYTPTFSGGSWQAALPLTNLQNRRLSKVARSTDATAASTKFDIDLGTLRSVRVAALCNHNFSLAAQVRVRGFSILPTLDLVGVTDAGWNNVNTPVITAAATTQGGMPLDRLANDSGVVQEYVYRQFTPTAMVPMTMQFTVMKGDIVNGQTGIIINNNVTAASIFEMYITWGTDFTPTVFSVVGSVVSTTAIGNAWTFNVTTTAPTSTSQAHNLIYNPNVSNALVGSGYIGSIMLFAATATVYDSSYQDVYPRLYTSGALPFGHPSYYDGEMTQEEADVQRVNFTHVMPTQQTCRYWRFAILDTANTSGYVQMGRLVLAFGYQPSINFMNGGTLGMESGTVRVDLDGGAAVFDPRPVKRKVDIVIDNIDRGEALGNLFDMQFRLNTSNQLYFILDPSDAPNLFRGSFLATLKELSTFQYAYYSRLGVPISLVEEL